MRVFPNARGSRTRRTLCVAALAVCASLCIALLSGFGPERVELRMPVNTEGQFACDAVAGSLGAGVDAQSLSDLMNQIESDRNKVRHHVALPTQDSLAALPQDYRQPTAQGGTLEYFYYSTQTYDPFDDRPMEKYAMVYLPQGYNPADTDTRYNVCYIMHGTGGDVIGYLGEPDAPDTLTYVLDHMIANGDIQPMIVVCMTYFHDNVSIETDDEDAWLARNFDSELRDLIVQLETHYNTYLESDDDDDVAASREHRIMAGFSEGALTTWYRMCDCMDCFAYYLPISGSLFWSVEVFTEHRGGANYTDRYLADAIDAQGYGPGDFFVYIVTGSKDFALQTVNDQVYAMQKDKDHFAFDDALGQANAVFLVIQGEDHDSHGRQAALYNALPVIDAMMQAA